MTKFHFYIVCSLICFMGIFNVPVQMVFWLLLACIYFWVLALWWAWEHRNDDVE